jgi:hypothetical protein
MDNANFPGFGPVPSRAQFCLAVLVRGGEFRSADFVIPIPDGGFSISGGIADNQFVPPEDDSQGIYGKPLIVPGGVTGVGRLSRALGNMGNVTARVQAVKPMIVHDLLAFDLTLFLRIQVRNTFVGGECFIGTPDEPLTIQVYRADWDQYIPKLTRDGLPDNVLAIGNIHLAASKFRVPASTGAGPKGAFNTLVNSRAGLPNTGSTTSLRIQVEAFLAHNPDFRRDS